MKVNETDKQLFLKYIQKYLFLGFDGKILTREQCGS